MNSARFDTLAKSLASRLNRRNLLRTAGRLARSAGWTPAEGRALTAGNLFVYQVR